MIHKLLGGVATLAGSTLLLVVGLAASRTRLAVPEPSVMLHDRHGVYLGEVNLPADGRLGFWPPGDALPDKVVAATLAIEDRRFSDHPGVDLRAIARAVRQNLVSGERISGASTLAMQVARMHDPGARTWSRKAIEAVTALFLVERYGREAVLTEYLTLAPYGNNVHGVRYAARRYFQKPLADLSWAEASLLAGLPQAPGQMNLYTDKGRARAIARARRVLVQLRAEGVLRESALAVAQEELDHLRPRLRPRRPAATLHPVLALDGLPTTDPERRTTLDLELQETLDALLVNAVRGWRDRGAEQAAAVVIEHDTMAVRAAVGSIGFEGTYAGAMDFTRQARTPGSALKPFVYARALDRGLLRPNTILDDLQQGPEGIRNADQDFLGPLLPRQALANSRNVPAVLLAEQLGLDDLFSTFQALRLHDGSGDPGQHGFGLALGAMPVRLLDLTVATGTLANDGVLRAPIWFEDSPKEPGQRVFSASTARLVRTWLSDPTARSPTFPRAGFVEQGFPVALKTGTSPDHRDSWAVAITERYLIGVWVGHPDWRPMRGLSGYRGAGSIVGKVLTHLHADQQHGLNGQPFVEPEGWTKTTVCALTGELATHRCDTPRTELFPPGEEPTQSCTGHVQEGGRVVLDLPPHYGPWLAAHHLPTAHPPLDPDREVVLNILSPSPGIAIMADPEINSAHSTLRLAASVDPPVEEVVWSVDGLPFATVSYPYVARWPVRPGSHTFSVAVANAPGRSPSVSVQAR